MAEAKIGPILVHRWLGDRPYKPTPEAVAFRRQGTGKVGHVVLPPTGKTLEVTTITFAENSAAVENGLQQIFGMVGTRQKVLWNGLDLSLMYKVEYVVESYEILRQQVFALAMVGGPHDVNRAFSPAIELRIAWKLLPVEAT